MNLEAIPKSFWHSASVALLSFTIGFLFISYQSGEITVRFNQLEVRTSTTEALEQSLQQQKQSIEEQADIIAQREQEVADLNQLLQAKLGEIKALQRRLQALQESGGSAVPRRLVSEIAAISRSDDFESQIKDKQKKLDVLQLQQQQKLQVYEQQKDLFVQQQIQQQKWIPK